MRLSRKGTMSLLLAGALVFGVAGPAQAAERTVRATVGGSSATCKVDVRVDSYATTVRNLTCTKAKAGMYYRTGGGTRVFIKNEHTGTALVERPLSGTYLEGHRYAGTRTVNGTANVSSPWYVYP